MQDFAVCSKWVTAVNVTFVFEIPSFLSPNKPVKKEECIVLIDWQLLSIILGIKM